MANVPPPIGGTDTNWIKDPGAMASWGGAGGDDLAQVPQEQWQELFDYVMSQRDGAPMYGVEALLPATTATHRATGDAPVPEYGVEPIAPVVATLRHDMDKILDHLGLK
jgi:hypothetical protein